MYLVIKNTTQGKSMVEITIQIKNADQIREFLKTRPQETKHQLNLAVAKTVKDVERETKKRSPVDTGRMRASVQSREYPSVLEGEVGVHTSYAIFVHENLRARHSVGEAKFLENAVRHLESKIQGFFLQAMENVIK